MDSGRTGCRPENDTCRIDDTRPQLNFGVLVVLGGLDHLDLDLNGCIGLLGTSAKRKTRRRERILKVFHDRFARLRGRDDLQPEDMDLIQAGADRTGRERARLAVALMRVRIDALRPSWW